MIILDTNALITFLDDPNTPEYYNLMILLEKNKKSALAITTPSLAEFIAGDENPYRTNFLIDPKSKISKLNFDIKSALISAEIYKQYRLLPKMKGTQIPHQKVKVDIQILAIAIANKATAIITRDVGMERLVKELNLPLEVYNFEDIKMDNDLLGESVFTEGRIIQ